MKLLQRLLLSLLLLLLLLSPGCETTIAPGADPLVVRTQQVLETSLTATDKFLRFEYDNRGKVSKEVTQVADYIRARFPPYHRVLQKLLAEYKQTRSAESKKLIDDYTLMLKELTTKAQEAK